MPEQRFLQLGTINGGSTPILADIAYLGSRRSVTLSTDYTLERPGSGLAGAFPQRPFLTGVIPQPAFPYTVTAGSTIELLECEATALVAANAATYA
jgi:hypothetical protein